MHRCNHLRSALIAGWSCFALGLSLAAAATVAPDDPPQLLQHADAVKSADHNDFTRTLQQLDAESARLTAAQQMYLRYLKAWQTAYFGDYATAIPQLDAIIAESKDVNLSFRAGVTAVNVLAISSRNEEAYARLSQLLDLAPQVSDQDARLQGLGVASQLYSEAGQYDLALIYTDRLIATAVNATTACKGRQHRINLLFKSGKLTLSEKAIQEGLEACSKANEPIYTNLIRVDVAKFEILHDRPGDAITLLQAGYEDVQRTHYPPLISSVDSALAQAYWKGGDAQNAQQYAQRAVEGAVKNEYTEPLVGAYEVLYQVAQKRGDYQSALAFYQKFAIADKGHLNDASARMLAYQMVKQQVQAKRLQVDALSKQNQVLQLRQEVSKKAAEARDLYLVMLLVVLGSILFWGWRTKRSEIRFMHISRHDGLTGIFNRHHFVSVAEGVLLQCERGSQDVSVILIDLDHFKVVNDTHGHAIGDKVLRCTVAACRAHLRENDLLGRLGGEEFGILMPDCVAATARQVAESVRRAIADCAGTEEGLDFPVSASFGIAGTRMSGYTLRHLLIHADSALYQAKREGRNRVVVYDHTKVDAKPLPPGVLDRRRG